MPAANPKMTPISQHNYSVASVSYLGPAYIEPEKPARRGTAASPGRQGRRQSHTVSAPAAGRVNSAAASR